MSLSAVSLVAALPAGFLAFLLVMTILQRPGFDKLAGFLQIFVVLSLLLVALIVLMPVGILLFVGREKQPATAKTHRAAAEEDAVETAAVADIDDELETLGTSRDEEFVDEFEESAEFESAESAEFEEEDELETSDEAFADPGNFDDSGIEDEFFADEDSGVVVEDEFETADADSEGDLFGSDDGFDEFDLGNFEDEDDQPKRQK